MEVVNDTSFEDALAIGLGPDQAPCIAVVVKATFELPSEPGGEVAIAEEQLPVAASDEHYEGDSTGSVRIESDQVPYKPRADIALVGTAYAPGGRPTEALDVLLRVGSTRKVLRVFGDRRWLFPSRVVMVPVISDPEPFTDMPLVYERAFGGFDRKAGKFHPQNHIGRGFLGKKTRPSVHGTLLPNLEDPSHLISSWNDEPMPAGLGFFDRSWQPRVGYAGTEEGMQNPHPVFGLAADFQPDFYNGAHPDLQVPDYLRGDEDVELVNLTPDGRRSFRLPGNRPRVRLSFQESSPTSESSEAVDIPVSSDGEEEQAAVEQPGSAVEQESLAMNLDTLVFLPDDGVFYQVWRGVHLVERLDSDEDLEHALLRIAQIEIENGKVEGTRRHRRGI